MGKEKLGIESLKKQLAEVQKQHAEAVAAMQSLANEQVRLLVAIEELERGPEPENA